MRLLNLCFLLFISANCLFAQDLSELSQTAAGQRIIEYFKTFNSGDEKSLENFFLQNLTQNAINERPLEKRLEFHKRIRTNFQSLEIMKITSVTESEISLLAQGKTGGWISYIFSYDKVSQKLTGWQIEPVESPDDDIKIEAPKSANELLSSIEKLLTEFVQKDKFSGVVLVAKDDKPRFQRVYGLANKEQNISNNLETKFNLGSINKIFTRIAIGQLANKGKISFDDKLGKHLKDYPNKEAAEKVTIRHLVTMKSGISDFFGEEYEKTSKDKFRNNSDFIPLFANKPLEFKPGTKEQYSNGGYILLGAIIEKVTGQSYYEYVKENIFKIAEMVNTDSFESDKIPTNTANGYTKFIRNDKWQNNFPTRPFRGSAAGGGYSTALDLLNFSKALKEEKLQIPDEDGKPRKETSLGIGGGSPGVNSFFTVNSQNGYTIIVLSNYDPPSAEKIGEQIRAWIREVSK